MSLLIALAEVVARAPVVLITPAPATAAWIANNLAVIIAGVGSTVAAVAGIIAAYLSNKNHNLVTQIHVDTNGRLSALTTEVAELKQAAIMAAAVAVATKKATDTAAAVAAVAAVAAAKALVVGAETIAGKAP